MDSRGPEYPPHPANGYSPWYQGLAEGQGSSEVWHYDILLLPIDILKGAGNISKQENMAFRHLVETAALQRSQSGPRPPWNSRRTCILLKPTNMCHRKYWHGIASVSECHGLSEAYMMNSAYTGAKLRFWVRTIYGVRTLPARVGIRLLSFLSRIQTKWPCSRILAMVR